MTSRIDAAELAAAPATYDAATPEEKAEFAQSQYHPGPIALDFMMWRQSLDYAALVDRYEAASPAERQVIAAQHPRDAENLRRYIVNVERNEFLEARGLATSERVALNRVAEHIWKQVIACIEAGHISARPQKRAMMQLLTLP